MMALLRRRRLPAAARPALHPEERIVAWAGATGDDVVVVTNHGVWLPGPAATRLGWHEIHKATWSGRQLALVPATTVGASDDYGQNDYGQGGSVDGYTVVADLPPVVVTLLDPDHVPNQVRTRVTRSIAYTGHHPLPGGGGVRVVARRVPGVDGLRWTVRYDDGTDAGCAQVRAATAAFVAEGRASLA